MLNETLYPDPERNGKALRIFHIRTILALALLVLSLVELYLPTSEFRLRNSSWADIGLGALFLLLSIFQAWFATNRRQSLTTPAFFVPLLAQGTLLGLGLYGFLASGAALDAGIVWLHLLRGTILLHIVVLHLHRLRRFPSYQTILDDLGERSALVFVLSFAVLIFVGTLLLAQPAFTSSGQATPLIDSLFTATSAACVTGLVTVDTGTHWNLAGQILILVLIEIGVLINMTLVIFFSRLLGVRMALYEEATQGTETSSTIANDVLHILAWVLAFQAVGTFILSRLWSGTVENPLWVAAFHSISAFCNAGFSIWDDSLTPYRGQVLVMGTIMSLIVIGGLGASVLFNIGAQIKSRWKGERRYVLNLHSRIVLASTIGLLIAGALVLAVTEWRGSMRSMSTVERFIFPLFQSVTSRTAGFNTVDIGSLSDSSLSVVMVLMFIGGSPGSTAGGIKTTTLFLLLIALWGIIRSREEPEIFGRTIPRNNIYRAAAIFILGFGLVLFFGILIMVIEEGRPGFTFRNILFEVTSAFATVGLSTGITAQLSAVGKFLVTLLMFIGRIGPITFAFALTHKSPSQTSAYPYEGVVVG